MDSLYLRLRESRFPTSHAIHAIFLAFLYATRMTVQDSGLPGTNSSALWAEEGAKAYVQGVHAAMCTAITRKLAILSALCAGRLQTR